MFSYDSDIESTWVTSAHVSSYKLIDIRFYFKGYESSKWLAIILDFTVHSAIKKIPQSGIRTSCPVLSPTPISNTKGPRETA